MREKFDGRTRTPGGQAAADESIVEVRNISKSFGGRLVLKNVTFQIGRGTVTGLVGENGAGKSTLLKILAGIEQPDAGTVVHHGTEIALAGYGEALNRGISMVFQEQALLLNMPVYENVFLGLSRGYQTGGVLRRREMCRRTRQIFERLGIAHMVSPTERLGSYDFGKRQLIEIARAFAVADIVGAKHPVVLLDEATASLDGEERTVLFELIERVRDQAAIIFVSHLLGELIDVCDQLVVLKDGAHVDTIPAKGATPAILHKLITGRERPEAFYREDRQRGSGGDVVLSCEGLRLPGKIDEFHLELRAGEVVGLAGVIGSGKEEVGRVLAGLLPHAGGQLRTFRRGGVGYVPRERMEEGVIPSQSVAWNASISGVWRGSFARAGLLRRRAERRWVRELVTRIDVRPADPSAKMASLSGGNQQKVVIGRWLVDTPPVLVLDSPTRGVDVGSRHSIYGMIRDLCDDGIAVVVISDDLLEVIGLSDRIVTMRERRATAELAAPLHAKPTEHDLVELMV